MLHITILDDQQSIVDEITNLLKIQNWDCTIHPFTSINDLDKNKKILSMTDILILDIELNHQRMNGIDIAKKLKATHPHLALIFITGYIDYVEDIFEVAPDQLLIKPIKAQKLYEGINRITERLAEKKQTIQINDKGIVKIINIEDIYFLESNRRKLTLYGAFEPISFYGRLDSFEKDLHPHFVRCHQSYLVNCSYISQFSRKGVILHNGNIIPVSQSRYNHSKQHLLTILDETTHI